MMDLEPVNLGQLIGELRRGVMDSRVGNERGRQHNLEQLALKTPALQQSLRYALLGAHRPLTAGELRVMTGQRFEPLAILQALAKMEDIRRVGPWGASTYELVIP